MTWRSTKRHAPSFLAQGVAVDARRARPARRRQRAPAGSTSSWRSRRHPRSPCWRSSGGPGPRPCRSGSWRTPAAHRHLRGVHRADCRQGGPSTGTHRPAWSTRPNRRCPRGRWPGCSDPAAGGSPRTRWRPCRPLSSRREVAAARRRAVTGRPPADRRRYRSGDGLRRPAPPAGDGGGRRRGGSAAARLQHGVRHADAGRRRPRRPVAGAPGRGPDGGDPRRIAGGGGGPRHAATQRLVRRAGGPARRALRRARLRGQGIGSAVIELLLVDGAGDRRRSDRDQRGRGRRRRPALLRAPRVLAHGGRLDRTGAVLRAGADRRLREPGAARRHARTYHRQP